MKKKIVITGTSSGIGAYLAENLTAEGHEVWGWARSSHSGKPWKSLRCDVSDWAEVQRATQEVQREWGSCDALICASAIHGPIGPAVLADPQEWSRAIRVNLDGTFYAIRALYPLLLKSGSRPKVLCFSGGGATSPRPNFSSYGVSKAGVVRLVETLACEWERQGIDINAIAPGPVHTRLTDEILALGPELVGEKDFQQAVKTRETGGATKEKIFAMVRHLLSRKSDGLTGKLLSVLWDDWAGFEGEKIHDLMKSEIYTLRRVT